MKFKFRCLFALFLFSLTFTLMLMGDDLVVPPFIAGKLSQLVTIFLSVIIQALPFILLGVFGSAFIQRFVSVELVEEILSRTSKLPGILIAIGTGFFFPVCDCGVFPIVRRLLAKQVPPYMAIAFLITAPLINPLTIWATATAFGGDLTVILSRIWMAILIGVLVSLAVSKTFPTMEHLFHQRALRELETSASKAEPPTHNCGYHEHSSSWSSGITEIIDHACIEFVEVVKYLTVGALLAATIQTFILKQSLMLITSNPAFSVLVMMLLALTLSLCAEADAFVARSLTFHFPLGSVMAFMVFGQMIDLKNTFLILKSFKLKAFLFIFGLCALLVFMFCSLFKLLSMFNNLRRF